MEGSNTLVCTGDTWNGTVPHCNGKPHIEEHLLSSSIIIFTLVKPTEPNLELIVSGNVVSEVNVGDWVLVSCYGRGGHPTPDIGIIMAGRPSASKDFRNARNSFTFTASEEDDGKTISCTAVNKVGISSTSKILRVQCKNLYKSNALFIIVHFFSSSFICSNHRSQCCKPSN